MPPNGCHKTQNKQNAPHTTMMCHCVAPTGLWLVVDSYPRVALGLGIFQGRAKPDGHPGSRSAPTEPRLPWAVTSGPCRGQGTNTPVRYHIRSVQRNSTTHNRKPNPGKAPSGATRYSPGWSEAAGRTKPGVKHTPQIRRPSGAPQKSPVRGDMLQPRANEPFRASAARG